MGKTSAADLEIISGLFLSAAEQMRRTLVRTAFNAVIYEVLDFGISIAVEPSIVPTLTAFLIVFASKPRRFFDALFMLSPNFFCASATFFCI